MRRLGLALSLILAAAGPVAAQARPDLGARVTALEAEVQRLSRLAAEAESTRQALADVEARLATMEEELARARRQTETEGAARHRMEGLDARVRALREDVSALASRVQIAEEQGGGQAAVVGSTDGGGLSVETDDGRFSFEPQGLLQLDLSYLHAPQIPDAYTFSLRRARFGFAGHLFTEQLRYHGLIELAQFSQLLEYYAEGDLPHGFGLRGGRFKVPFGRAALVDARDLAFITRAQAVQEWSYGRDLGLLGWWSGLADRLLVQAALQNGAGTAAVDDNQYFMTSARVVGAVLGGGVDLEEGDHGGRADPSLQLGGSVSYQHLNVPSAWGYLALPEGQAPRPILDRDIDADGSIDTMFIVQLGVDVALRWRGLGVEAEGFWRHDGWRAIDENQGPNSFEPDESFMGGYLQATYFVIPGRLQVGARGYYSQISAAAHHGQQAIRASSLCELSNGDLFVCPLPISDASWEAVGRVAYYRYRSGVELAAEYSYRRYTSRHDQPLPGKLGQHSVIVEGQVAF